MEAPAGQTEVRRCDRHELVAQQKGTSNLVDDKGEGHRSNAVALQHSGSTSVTNGALSYRPETAATCMRGLHG